MTENNPQNLKAQANVKRIERILTESPELLITLLEKSQSIPSVIVPIMQLASRHL